MIIIGKKATLILACAIAAMVLTSCTSLNGAEGRSEIVDSNTFIDDSGEEFHVDKPYTKIVSLYSAHTENIYSLGAGDSLVGVSDTSIYPPKAAFLPRYDYKSDPEPLIAADPDLVIIRPFVERNYPDYVRTLENAGLTVVSLYPESNDDFEKYIEILGMITGKEEQAEMELSKLSERIASIESKLAKAEEKPKVFFESTKTNYRTVTIDSNPARAIELAGGVNIADDATPIERGSTVAEYGIEKLMMNADDIDVYISQRGAMNSGGSLISIPQREGFKAIKAVKEGRILELNEKLISSPTFRYYKGVTEIARMLHPEVMDDYSEYKSDELLTREQYAELVVKLWHIPIFIPSSSHYYEKEYYNHTYGMFDDVSWDDENFDYIETAAINSLIKGSKAEGGSEHFDKGGHVTRENLAFTLYIMGDFESSESHMAVNDLEDCSNGEIVQKIVDSGIMETDKGGNFNPKSEVTGKEAIETLEKLEDFE